MRYKSSLCWLRRDLRLKDQTVLRDACAQSQEVFVAFVFDTNILKKLKKNDRRVTFIYETLRDLHTKLKSMGNTLIVLHGDPRKKIPELVDTLQVEAVFTGRDYESYAKERDFAVKNTLSKKNVAFHSIKDHVIFEGLELQTQSSTPFKVFTPYKNAWLKKIRKPDFDERKPDLAMLSQRKDLKSDAWSLQDLGFQKTDLLVSTGEDAAQKGLKEFKKKIDTYKTSRDFPKLNGTSMLSVHLRFGTLSVREAVRLAQVTRNEGSRTWLSEIIWRDFYHMILDQFPHVESQSFKPECEKLKWSGRLEHFEAWKRGQTGYPLVDAAMRHFATTGWMHNRLRMVVAMFLTKDLLVDWKLGESYFAENLLDFDKAANNGGWQWSASTGCDAQPYFRIFNPYAQSEKFDPDGDFIRQHIPELRNYDSKWIHRPHEAPAALRSQWGLEPYPAPIVDHAIQREKALEMFQRLK